MRRLVPIVLALFVFPLPASVGAVGSTGTFVHGRGAGALEALRSIGVGAVATFPQVGVAYAPLTAGQLRLLASDPRVASLEPDRPLRTMTARPLSATRVADASIALRDRSGQPVDGRGVGVAVVDSGADATHPDLASAVVRNLKMLNAKPQPLANTDDGGGHGTHVTGIVAGTGGSSGGGYRGVAPGAAVTVLGAGTGLHVFFASQSLQWILDNHARVSPRIRVVNNSYGSDGAFNPAGVLSKLTTKLVEAGVVVVWAAGNEGGDGSADTTTAESKHPMPGVLSVANYDDLGDGRRNGRLDASSSRGFRGDPTTWPDVSAPGTNLMSTCRLAFPVCNAHLKPSRTYPNLYAELSGTSMAAPVVTGLVALLLQADPSLTPAGIENLLEDTAFRFGGGGYVSDPANPDGVSSFDRGHGLVDAVAALRAAGAVG